MTDPLTLIHGDALSSLREREDESVQCCVTSPPYWSLRDYGVEALVWDGTEGCDHQWGDTISVNATNHTDKRRWNHTRNGRDEEQPIEKRVAWLRTVVDQGNVCEVCGAWRGCLGLEPTPELYVSHVVDVFREVKRVLRNDGTLWLNLGDSYFASGQGYGDTKTTNKSHNGSRQRVKPDWSKCEGLKPKDLVGIPWMAAFGLRADGWYLRSDIIWSKPNPMPESVTDRPTRSHEYVFLLSKSQRYFYDANAIAEPLDRPEEGQRKTPARFGGADKWPEAQKQSRLHSGNEYLGTATGTRNKRSVWPIATRPFPEAHFATFPRDLVEPCVLAGSRAGDVVLDCFAGSGTTAKVSIELGRKAIAIEPKAEYVEMIKKRCQTTIGLPLAI
jgi:DNA modification methylase